MVSVKAAFNDFRNGLKIIFGKPNAGEGDRKLAKMSLLVEGMIPTYGKDAVRKQVIKSIENDLRRDAKRGGVFAVEQRIQRALKTPEYMRMLHKLGMEEPEIRVLAMQAVKQQGGDV